MTLLDAVDDLTKLSRTLVIQGDTGSRVEHPSLLEQLEAAIYATIGIGGSGSLANERNMLDGDALYQMSKIRVTVQSWAQTVGVTYRQQATTGELLRSWYVKHTASNPSPEVDGFHLMQLRKWAGMIRGKLDPPKQKDLPDACPVCLSSTFWKEGQQYPRPLVIHYREGDDLVSKAKGLCRACEAVWGARELAYAIEEAERTAQAG
jgi:hypothetical protein